MCDHPLTRRTLLHGMALGISALALPRFLWASNTGESTTPAVTADQALQWLQEGNARFLAGTSERPNLTPERIAETFNHGQHPFATILSCSDSRVPVEHIFDRGIGDLFIIRVAGNVADTDEIGTSEYGAGHLLTPLIVVLGHSKCGAVTAVVKGDKVGGSIPQLVDNIIPAAQRAKEKGLTGEALILDAIRENVYQSIQDLQRHSAELHHLAQEGKVKLVGAIYHIENGSVEWLPPAPQPIAAPAPQADSKAEVEKSIAAWALAWSSKNIGEYTDFYSEDAFMPDNFPSRAAWKRERARIFKEAGQIRVTLSNLQITLPQEDQAEATFTQEYRSRQYQDRVQKRLSLRKEDGTWKITQESVD
ncbi:MAG: nuclear transport factor 2 family protein [Magnetococcus sp. YQC-3]